MDNKFSFRKNWPLEGAAALRIESAKIQYVSEASEEVREREVIDIHIDKDSAQCYEVRRWPFRFMYFPMCLMAIIAFIQTVFYRFLGKVNEIKNREFPKNPGLIWCSTSSVCSIIRKYVATYRALDVIYNFSTHVVPTLKRGDKWWSNFWLSYVLINSGGLRNRLRLVERELFQEIISYCRENDKHQIDLLSVACGSAQGVMAVAKRCKSLGIKVNITLLDLNKDALDYCIDRASQLELSFECIHGNSRYLRELVGSRSFDIVEVVGFLDYKDKMKSIALLTTLNGVLKEGGRLLTANIIPNPEKFFLDHVVGWYMHYKKPSELGEIMKIAGYKAIRLFIEPQRVHVVGVAKK